MFNLSPVREVPAELLALVDVLIVNEHELAALVGDAAAAEGAESGDWSDAATALAARQGIRTAVVTLGGAGSVVVESGEAGDSDAVTATRVDALPVDVVDTTGCGDSYMGALMAGLASGASVNDAARLAAAVAAYAAGGEGAQASYGTADQVRRFAETGRRG